MLYIQQSLLAAGPSFTFGRRLEQNQNLYSVLVWFRHFVKPFLCSRAPRRMRIIAELDDDYLFAGQHGWRMWWPDDKAVGCREHVL